MQHGTMTHYTLPANKPNSSYFLIVLESARQSRDKYQFASLGLGSVRDQLLSQEIAPVTSVHRKWDSLALTLSNKIIQKL